MTGQFLDRYQQGENALLINVQLPNSSDLDYEITEFSLLVKSAGANIVDLIIVNRHHPEIKYFIGTGKVADIKTIIIDNKNIDLVIFNNDLSPAQERNLEKILECRVLDRTGLILDIFASRAKSHAGKLQVELAQLKHLSTRLIRGWTHLERQKGGIGLRGPGETQLESDKRMISNRIKQINKKLSKVTAARIIGRKSRKKAELSTVSLVGYSNAGKSTLFNQLVSETIYAENRLFSTLDSTLRKLTVSKHLSIILADTVGFISRLPHALVESFKSTLEEVSEADLLLHIIDISQENYTEQKLNVLDVLNEIDANKIPQLEVMNKIDLLDEFEPRIDRNEFGKPTRVWLSAQTGIGCNLLLQCLGEIFTNNIVKGTIILGVDDGDIRAKLFAESNILKETYQDNGSCELSLQIEQRVLDRCNLWDRFVFI